jgi:hypothetical protein
MLGIMMGRNSESIVELRKTESLDPLSLIISADIADALCVAHLYVGLGDQDQAMTWLNKAYEARFKASILLRPAFDLLRSSAVSVSRHESR